MIECMRISRRGFLETAAGSVAFPAWLGAQVDKKTGMPTRVLGRTRARVSVLGFGCGSRWLSYPNRDAAVAALNHALDLGVNYVDSAFSYGKGQSEEWVGEVMKTRRKDAWLVTKLNDRTYDGAMKLIEGGLKRLQTDHIDLIHMHALLGEDDLAKAEQSNGLIKALYKAREQKICRAIGVTCHHDPHVLKTAIERHDFDCTQMALNAARIGNSAVSSKPNMADCFQTVALPVALKKRMGVTAMKVFGQEKLSGKAPVGSLVRYAMSLPVAACVIGMPKPEHVDDNIRIAKAFQAMPTNEMESLSRELALKYKVAMDRYFHNHVDC
jgi:predicted aldo/keto reductase-like oxidoreductase